MWFSKIPESSTPPVIAPAGTFVVLALTLVAFLGTVTPAQGQGVSLGVNPDSALAAKIEAFRGSPIALDEAFQLAMEQSTAVQEAASALVAAQQAVRRDKGTFDPELFVDLEKLSNDRTDLLRSKRVEIDRVRPGQIDRVRILLERSDIGSRWLQWILPDAEPLE